MEAVKELIQFENLQVEIWRRPYQRSLNLRLRPDGRLRMTCGRGVAHRELLRFLEDSREFIGKAQRELRALRERYPEKSYVSGETFWHFGEQVPLDVVWSWHSRARVRAAGPGLEMMAPVASTVPERRRAMHEYFRKIARPLLARKLEASAAEMGVRPAKFSLRGQRTRWGSCSARAEISLNWKLLAAPEWVIDYVVIHELAHIYHLDHSPRFWAVVDRHCPRRGEARRWLRQHEPAIARQFLVPEAESR